MTSEPTPRPTDRAAQARQGARMSRRVRASLLAPLVLFLASCAKDAPLDSLDPAGPRAKSIDDLQNPVFAIAGVVFLAVNLGVLFLAWKFKRSEEHTSELQSLMRLS